MRDLQTTVQVVGRSLEPDHHRIRDFLTRTAQPYSFVEAGTEDAVELLGRYGLTEDDLPVVVDGAKLHARITVEQLARNWGISSPPARQHYDLVIVGAGPAGLSAAVYAASDGLSTLVLEEDVPGGQASHTSLIENFFGFVDGIGGAELARLAGRQAERFGAELVLMRGVVGGSIDGLGRPVLEVAGGYEVTADVAVVAPGMVWRHLEVDGVRELLDRGVYYGAGRSEAARCGGDDVVVVGAGNAAGQAVMNLADAGARVLMVVRGDRLAAKMSGYLVERIERHPLIEVRLRTEVVAVDAADGVLASVTIESADGVLERRTARALFLCLGGVPRTGWAKHIGVQLNPAGFVLTGPDLLRDGRRPEGWVPERDPLTLETTVPGLFAAGDVRSGSTKRVAGAVGEGAMAVALVHHRLEELAAAG